MGMSLSDIEAKADEYLTELLATDSDAAAASWLYRLRGLRDLAQIKAVGDQRAQWNASVGMRKESAASGVLFCSSTLSLSKDEYYVCTIPAPHTGQHRGGGKWWAGPGNGKQEAGPTKPDPGYSEAWDHGHSQGHTDGVNAQYEKTKPAVDRLHELVSMWNGFSQDQSERDMDELRRNTRDGWYAEGQAVAWGKAAAMLEDILTGGGI